MQYITAGMAKVLAWEVTKVSTEVPEEAYFRLAAGPEGRSLELVVPGGPGQPARRFADPFPLMPDPTVACAPEPAVGHCVGVCLCGCDCLSMSCAFVPC